MLQLQLANHLAPAPPLLTSLLAGAVAAPTNAAGQGKRFEKGRELLDHMITYATDAKTCRHAALLSYFGEQQPGGRCAGVCDVCLGQVVPLEVRKRKRDGQREAAGELGEEEDGFALEEDAGGVGGGYNEDGEGNGGYGDGGLRDGDDGDCAWDEDYRGGEGEDGRHEEEYAGGTEEGEGEDEGEEGEGTGEGEEGSELSLGDGGGDGGGGGGEGWEAEIDGAGGVDCYEEDGLDSGDRHQGPGRQQQQQQQQQQQEQAAPLPRLLQQEQQQVAGSMKPTRAGSGGQAGQQLNQSRSSGRQGFVIPALKPPPKGSTSRAAGTVLQAELTTQNHQRSKAAAAAAAAAVGLGQGKVTMPKPALAAAAASPWVKVSRPSAGTAAAAAVTVSGRGGAIEGSVLNLAKGSSSSDTRSALQEQQLPPQQRQQKQRSTSAAGFDHLTAWQAPAPDKPVQAGFVTAASLMKAT